MVSIDAYQYFGTDVLYLGYLSRFLKPGGMLGIVMPALMQEMGDVIPDHLTRPQANGKVFWEDGCRSFKTADWWHKLWAGDSSVTDVRMEILRDCWRWMLIFCVKVISAFFSPKSGCGSLSRNIEKKTSRDNS